ncbi:MAG: 30S ribosomal protein S15 [Bacteroidota bacterium]|nr:30S ribosomal protein S15 [Bacteroidota bacterium]
MYLTPEKKQAIFKKHSFSSKPTDTGSAESQVALFTERINYLTGHLSTNKKDHSTKMGLLKLVGKRRRLLDHLQHTDVQRYRDIVAKLDLRK